MLVFGGLIPAYAADVKSEKGSLSDFDSILIRVPGKVELHQGRYHSYSIIAEPNVVKSIAFKVHGRRLVIETTMDFETQKPLEIALSLVSLARLEVTGSVDVLSKVGTHVQTLTVISDGAGTMDLRAIQTKAVNVQIRGAGTVVLDGRTDKLDVVLAGSGDAKMRKLQSTDAKVSISGSGEVIVAASRFLEASISGTGDILYAGNPMITQRISGAGEVQKVR